MKKFGKRLSVLMMVLLLLVTVSACGSKLKNSQYIGTWKGTTAQYSDVEMTVDDTIGETTISFDAKGNCTLTSGGSEQSGSWEETDTGVSIDGGDLQMTLTDGKLVMTIDGVTVYFEKQTTEDA